MKNKKNFIIILVIILIIFMLFFLNRKNDSKVKYVFLFIGDGMSSAQVELTEMFDNMNENNSFDNQKLLSFSKFPAIGLRKNYSGSSYVTDSAASATALASGINTYNGSINITNDGKEVKPITYSLKKKGMKIGIVTSVTLNHATPAAFYANASYRDDYNEIASDLLESNFDYFAGGDITLYSDYDEYYKKAKNKGYNIINNDEDLFNLTGKNIIISPNTTGNGFLPFALDSKSNFNLANYVKIGIKSLDNESGFFMMVESGLIDVAGHNNDARSVISEVKELDYAVQEALEFYKKHKDETLIIVTGDHETGGLSLGSNELPYLIDTYNLNNQKTSYEKIDEYAQKVFEEKINYDNFKNYVYEKYSLDNDELDYVYNDIIDGNIESLKNYILDYNCKNSGISFTTMNHTGDRIPVYAYGKNSELFNGIYDMKSFNKRLNKAIK